MCVGILRHIPKYMDRMTNNNKMLINDSSYYFAVRVVYTQITVKWGIRYIDESFLVWIISSTYLSHEAIIWACITSFACIQFYSVLSFLSILCYFLSLEDNSGYINSGYGDVRYRVYIWEFSCLDYSFDVLISYISNLGLYNGFFHIYFTWCLIACPWVFVLMIQFSIHALWLRFIDTCVPI